jgi:DnaJ-class molecular chaperone
MEKYCGSCYGAGRVPCRVCNSTGRVTLIKGNMTFQLVCPDCSGSGHVNCQKCQGTGKVNE